MRKHNQKIIVGLSPTRYEIMVFENDALIGHKSARPSDTDADTAWAAHIQQFEKQLTRWVLELDIKQAPTTVLYTGIDSFAAVYDFPVATDESNAIRAAQMAAADTLSYPLDCNAHHEQCLFKDTRCGPDDTLRLWTLVSADTEASVLAISIALKTAGLLCKRIIPSNSASITAAVSQLTKTATEESHMLLWLGEHTSVFALGNTDSLHFVRTVPVGTENIVEALSRIPNTVDGMSSAKLSADDAQALLIRSGIPTHQDWQDKPTGLDARAVMPLIHPVLQKLTIEAKQSLRFGVDEQTRASMQLMICGPGSQITGIADFLAKGIGLDQFDNKECEPSGALCSDAGMLHAPDSDFVVLTPQSVKTQRTMRKSKFALAIGMAAAFLALAIDGVYSWHSYHSTQAMLDSAGFVQSASVPNNASIAREKAMKAQRGLAGAKSRMAKAIPTAAPIAELLADLARLTPKEARLTDVSYTVKKGKSLCTLQGMASSVSGTTGSETIAAYLDALTASPLVLDARLGETRRIVDTSQNAISFEIDLDLLTLPYQTERNRQADASEVSEQ